MKILFAAILLALFVSTSAIAEKPAWAGKGKPSAEQKELSQSMRDSHDDEEEHKDKKDKKDKKSKHDEDDEDDEKEKDKNNKSQDDRTELGKGSEKGQEQRETHSKKWWNIFGD